MLLPFVLRIIFLHRKGGFELSRFPSFCSTFSFSFILFFFHFLTFSLNLFLFFVSSFLFCFLPLSFFFPSFFLSKVILRSCKYRYLRPPMFYFPSFFPSASYLPSLSPYCLCSLLSLFLFISSSFPLSNLPSYLADRTMLNISFLSALCIWMAFGAETGFQPGVCMCACVCD